MRASLLPPLFLWLVLLAACGEDRPAEAAAPSPEAPAGRPGEAAILARWDDAQAEVERIREQQRDTTAPDTDRRLRLRRAATLDHQLSLAILRRDEAELDFYALACPEEARAIAESFRATAERERAAREQWLEARLESIDADVELTDRIEDERADDAAIERATSRAETATARTDDLESAVGDAWDEHFDLRLDAHQACDERLPRAVD